MDNYFKTNQKDLCSGCGACASVCPQNCITMKEDSEGFRYPIINKKKCIHCGACERVCPVISKKEREDNYLEAYASFNRDETVRQHSSSGGIFTLLAEYILNKKGIVYGASLEDITTLKHIRIESKKDLNKLRGSKYFQSNTTGIYELVKQDLEDKREVLFTGTPCQIEALYKFLNKDYNNLLTQDIICHGVPSKKIWEKYISELETKNNKKVVSASFRNKDKGWKNNQLNFVFDDKSEYKEESKKNSYMQLFLSDLILRPSCYSCQFKERYRNSDITLADFWGIEKVNPKMFDDKGTSLLIINSKKGKKIIDLLNKKMIKEEVNIDESIKYNPSMIRSADRPLNRDKVFNDLDKSTSDLVKKYTENRYLRKIKRIVKKLLHS